MSRARPTVLTASSLTAVPYLGRVWVSPSSVWRVLFLADKHFRPLPKPGRSVRKPFPDWVDYRPNSLWTYDTTHFTPGW